MSPEIKLLDYSPHLKKDLEEINKGWLKEFFDLEEFENDHLLAPEKQILDPGGILLFASINDEIVGTVGLCKITDSCYELVKMGVKPSFRGMKIGQALINEVLQRAKSMGVSELVLYSHSKLQAALALYAKVGFIEVEKECGKYERCDIKMVYSVQP